jgi:hypothetical protein
LPQANEDKVQKKVVAGKIILFDKGLGQIQMALEEGSSFILPK